MPHVLPPIRKCNTKHSFGIVDPFNFSVLDEWAELTLNLLSTFVVINLNTKPLN